MQKKEISEQCSFLSLSFAPFPQKLQKMTTVWEHDNCIKGSSKKGCDAFTWSNYNGSICFLYRFIKGTFENGKTRALLNARAGRGTQQSGAPRPPPPTLPSPTSSPVAATSAGTFLSYWRRTNQKWKEINSRFVHRGKTIMDAGFHHEMAAPVKIGGRFEASLLFLKLNLRRVSQMQYQ